MLLWRDMCKAYIKIIWLIFVNMKYLHRPRLALVWRGTQCSKDKVFPSELLTLLSGPTQCGTSRHQWHYRHKARRLYQNIILIKYNRNCSDFYKKKSTICCSYISITASENDLRIWYFRASNKMISGINFRQFSSPLVKMASFR